MSIRDTILANVSTQLATTSLKVSNELPWSAGDIPLYEKNMKTVYVDEAQLEIEPLLLTLDACDVFDQVERCTAYVMVDAKNTPSDMPTIITNMINARMSVVAKRYNLCNMTTVTDADRITYSFEYEFRSVYNP